mmetsp:Transcript_10532/g.15395  ORF Transcript_10532/g.15395 Transcript_10532/m.15395 type:complete len:379 (+) Transcript_10532:47-1183(+)
MPDDKKKQIKTLWDIIKEKRLNSDSNESKTSDGIETTDESTPTKHIEKDLLIMGGKKSGKTSLLYNVKKKKADQVPATIALEYSNMTKNQNYKVTVCNFWELAGGRALTTLTNDLLRNSNASSFSVVITVDLSQPANVLSDVMYFFDVVDTMFQNIDESLQEKLVRKAKKKLSYFGCQDIDKINVFPIPVVVIGTKYDELSSMGNMQHLKNMARGLRFLCHSRGASLLYSGKFGKGSNEREHSDQFISDIFSYFIFDKKPSTKFHFDDAGLIRVIAGGDSFSSIGPIPPPPPGRGPEFTKADELMVEGRPEYEKWLRFSYKSFGAPTEAATNTSVALDAYPEPSVDQMRSQKQQELVRYRAVIRKELDKKKRYRAVQS